eukprot:1161003-Pelagomonas_calceolata.AAC.12
MHAVKRSMSKSTKSTNSPCDHPSWSPPTAVRFFSFSISTTPRVGPFAVWELLIAYLHVISMLVANIHEFRGPIWGGRVLGGTPVDRYLGHRRIDNNRYHPHHAALTKAPGCKVAMCADAGQREEEPDAITCAQVCAGPGAGMASDPGSHGMRSSSSRRERGKGGIAMLGVARNTMA